MTFNELLQNIEQMYDCPDLFTLEDYRVDQLTSEEQSEIEYHVQICSNCQNDLANLRLNQGAPTEELSLPALKTAASSNLLIQDLPRPQFMEGQVWITYAQVDLKSHFLSSSTELVKSSFQRIFCILETQESDFRNPQFQRLVVCPVSEHIEFASEFDMLISSQDLNGLVSGEKVLIEVAQHQEALALHFDRCLGQVDNVSETWNFYQKHQQLPLSFLRGGTPVKGGAHERFKILETKHIQYLKHPVEALNSLKKSSQNCFVGLSPKGISKQKIEKEDKRLARSWTQETSFQTLAASSQVDKSQIQELKSHDIIALTEDMRLEIWPREDSLEFYCITQTGQEVEGIEIAFVDESGEFQSIFTDDLGGCELPYTNFLKNEETLLYFSCKEEDTPRYIYPVLLKS